MTIDEAIADNLRIAEGQDRCAEISVSEHAKERMKVCAAEHRQIVEWLTELKEAKRILKMAVEDFSKMPCNNDTHSHDSCYICVKHGNCSYADSFKWCKADIALKLIGETNVDR